MAKASVRRRTVNVPLEVVTNEEGEQFSGSPFFTREGGDTPHIDRIAVIRDEPIDEGFVGWLQADANEDQLSRKFGGGKYRLQGRDVNGHSIKGAFRTVSIGGEPRFENRVSLAKYERIRRQELGQEEIAGPARKSEIGALELFELHERKAEATRQQAREEFDRREAEREAAHKRELERMKIEQEARERDRRAEDERRERDRQAADERRERDAEGARARDREFFAGMIKLQGETATRAAAATPAPMGVAEVLTLLSTARDLFGAGEGAGSSDPVTELMKNLPAILDKSQGIAQQLTGGGEEAAGAAAEQEAADGMTLTGIHGKELARVVEHLQQQGLNPDVVLLKAFRALGKLRKAAAPAAQNAGGNVSAPDGKQAAADKKSAPRQATRPVRARARARVTRRGGKAASGAAARARRR